MKERECVWVQKYYALLFSYFCAEVGSFPSFVLVFSAFLAHTHSSCHHSLSSSVCFVSSSAFCWRCSLLFFILVTHFFTPSCSLSSSLSSSLQRLLRARRQVKCRLALFVLLHARVCVGERRRRWPEHCERRLCLWVEKNRCGGGGGRDGNGRRGSCFGEAILSQVTLRLSDGDDERRRLETRGSFRSPPLLPSPFPASSSHFSFFH